MKKQQDALKRWDPIATINGATNPKDFDFNPLAVKTSNVAAST
jgi:hypothetical protein